jgi:hypothetical protein
MNSVGIDLHRNRSQIAVIDGQGELSLLAGMLTHPGSVA